MNERPRLACLPNGPYYLLNDMQASPVPNLVRATGAPCATVRGVALCRCGGSKNKPFCDGTHSTNGFSDRKLADSKANRRESYAIDDMEAKPPERPPKVVVTDNGPYAVSGGIELMNVEFGDGASREHYTLCRCGASANKPFCDGSHFRIEFRDPV